MHTLPEPAPPDQTRDPIAVDIDQTIGAIRDAISTAQTASAGRDYLTGAREHLTGLTETWARWLNTLPAGTIHTRHALICASATSHAQRATALIIRAIEATDPDHRADCLIDARREIAGLDHDAADRERLCSFAKPGRAA